MKRSPSTPPTIAELTAGFLNRPADAEALAAAADAIGEVQPHEVSVGFRAEPGLAWRGSLEVLAAFGLSTSPIPAPGDWGSLVVRQESVAALPFALGNYPQRVRDLDTLVRSDDVTNLLPQSVDAAAASTGLLKWGTRHLQSGELPHALIAAANYRAARDFDRANEALKGLKSAVGTGWDAVLANEEAALLWHRGEYAKAADLWDTLPDSAPVQFNRGMASLFLGRPGAAEHLRAAVAGLPETSAWHHLANLYLTLAELRG